MKRFYPFLILCLLASLKAAAQPGSLDYSFTTDFSSQFSVMAPAIVQKDGKVIVGGSFNINFIDGKKLSHLARLNSDGSLDLSFKIGKGVDGQVKYLAEFPDGRMLVSGEFFNFDGKPCKSAIILNADGTRDSSFKTTYGNQEIYDIALLPDGKVLIYGKDGDKIQNAALVRLNPDGSLDSTFQKVSVLAKNAPVDIIPLPNGNTLFSAQDFKYKSHLYLIKPDGTIDYTFNFETEVSMNNFSVSAFKKLKDGKMILSGNFVTNADSKLRFVVRLTENCKIDYTFFPDVMNRYQAMTISCIYVQEDDKIILGGFFTGPSAEKSTALIRLHKNGLMDTTFNAEGGFNAFASNIVKYGDKKAIVTGSFDRYRSFFTSNVARIYLEDTAVINNPVKSGNFSFVISSNPNNGKFKINANRIIKSMDVIDLNGKVVFSYIFDSQTPEIDMTACANGIYLIRCYSDFEQATVKMLKH